MSIVNAAGGLGYHFAAIWFAPKLWRPFREDLARVLERRISARPGKTLVLVGTSGGYCLEAAFLRGFSAVIAVDVDPIAGWILRRRFGGCVRFVRQDFFRTLAEMDWDLARWLESIGAGGDKFLLFSNLLGQLGFLYRERERRQIEAGLARALRGSIPWLSFHDRFSVLVGLTPRLPFTYPERPESMRLAAEWSAGWPEERRPVFEEHEIGEWIRVAQGPFEYLAWRLDSRRTQLIEVCGSSAIPV